MEATGGEHRDILDDLEAKIIKLWEKDRAFVEDNEFYDYDSREYDAREHLAELDADALNLEWTTEVDRYTKPGFVDPKEQLRQKLNAKLDAINEWRQEKKLVEAQLNDLEKERATLVVNSRLQRDIDANNRSNGVNSQIAPENVQPIYSGPDDRWRECGFVIAKIGEQYGLLDKEGNAAIPFQYEYLGLTFKDRPELGAVRDGYLIAMKDAKVNVIDINNELSMPFRYTEADILEFKYPYIEFSEHPAHKTEQERAANLQELETRCIRHDWRYLYADSAKERARGRRTEDELDDCFAAIDERDLPQAVALLNSYQSGAGNVRVKKIEGLKNADSYVFIGHPVVEYITPQEHINPIFDRLVDAEKSRFQIVNWQYDYGWGMNGYDYWAFEEAQRTALYDCETRMDSLCDELCALEDRVQKYSSSESKAKHAAVQITPLLQKIEKLMQQQDKPGQGSSMYRKLE